MTGFLHVENTHMAGGTLGHESDRMCKQLIDTLIKVGEMDDVNEACIMDDMELNDYTTLMKRLEELRILQYCIPEERQGEYSKNIAKSFSTAQRVQPILNGSIVASKSTPGVANI